MSDTHEPGRATEWRSEVVTVTLLSRARVDSHPGFQSTDFMMLGGLERSLSIGGGRKSISGRVEDGRGAISGVLEDDTLVCLDCCADLHVVLREGNLHGFRVRFPQPRRAFDVAEQEVQRDHQGTIPAG